MQYIDRYVAEVGKRLPRKGREDIEAELRSTLLDMLEDRARTQGRSADQELERALLREYGAPDKVAASYRPLPHIIGPRMFPFFWMVLRIVIAALAGVLVITSGIQIAAASPMAPAALLRMVGNSALGLLQACIQAFGNVVLVFAILERFVPASEFKLDDGKEWDPEQLVKTPEPDEIRPWEAIVGIVLTAGALIVLNFYPQIVGGLFRVGNEWISVAIFSEAFFRWLPWINAAWCLEIVLNLLLLRRGRWQVSSRLLSLAIKVLQIVIGFLLLSGPSFLAVTPEALSELGVFSPETSQILGGLLRTAVSGVIALVVLLTAVDAVKAAYRLFAARRPVSSAK